MKNSTLRHLVLLLVCFCCCQLWCFGQQPQPPKVGDVVFSTDFEENDVKAGWAGTVQLDQGYQSEHALVISNPVGKENSSVSVARDLPFAQLRGCKIVFSAMVKGENVSKKPQNWNGVKYMVPMEAGATKLWPQGDIPVGTFDWRPVAFMVQVPDTATSIKLLLGLELVSGKVWFDNVKVTVRHLAVQDNPRLVQKTLYKGHSLPRLRGTMIAPTAMSEDDVRVLAKDWNANVVRWQLVGWRPQGATLDLNAYEAWFNDQLSKFDAALPFCKKYGLMVVLDLHCAPGGSAESGKNLFNDASCQQKFIEIWQRMAKKYKNEPTIWGYDLFNEPNEKSVSFDLPDWQELAERTAKAIRAIDPKRALIIEPAYGGGPEGLTSFQPIDVPNVVYSVHMYTPGQFTHQGVTSVMGNTWVKYAYPCDIGGVYWNKAQLEKALQPVIDFQKKYNVHIYIGEFSAIRWAPDNSAARYLSDVIDIFEAHGWDWTYHAYREWDGWSVEHGSDPNDHQRSATPTDRQLLLQKWFAQNQKPKW
ncbi:MAG TPA: cellulase family glycosylhydrolase [Armatimonadota bacterium]|nr:cellulase family glycosylhydrolase [Armatimonadota bacterium]